MSDPVLRIARANAQNGLRSPPDKEIAIGVNVQRSHPELVWNIDRSHPGDPAVGGAVEFAEVASDRPRLVLESVTRAPVLSIVNHCLSPPLRSVGQRPRIDRH